MADVSDKLSITLKLGGQIYQMTIDRKMEFVYRDAEKLINSRLNYYARTYPQQGREMYFSMIALDIAVQRVSSEHEGNLGAVADDLRRLVDEIDESLEKK